MRIHRHAGWLVLAVLALSACGQSQPPAAPPPVAPEVSGIEDFGSVPPPGVVPSESTPVPPPPPPPTDNPKPPVAPAPETCVPYNAAALTVVANGDAWILKDDSLNLKIFDTKADAEDAKKVARNWTRYCTIGGKNTRPVRSRYIFSYFQMPSGLPLGSAPQFDCVPYDPAKLTIHSGVAHPADQSETAWALKSGATALLYFATEADAQRGKLVAAANKQLCFIGQDNDRPDPDRYILEYWRP